MKNSLLQRNFKWNTYDGQNLILKDFVHLFKINIDFNYSKIQPHGILSSSELAKSKLFLKSQDRENYIVRKYLLRLIVSKFVQLHPAEIEFSRTANKKPFHEAVHFNVSHTNNQAVIAISSSPIGIDTEFINPNFDFTYILDASFSEKESFFVKQSVDLTLNFYTLWTRKEALLKATGEGLVDQMNLVPSMENHLKRAGQEFRIYSFESPEKTVISAAFDSKIKQPELWVCSDPSIFS